MALGHLVARSGRGLAIGAAILAAVGLTAAPRPAQALSPAAGVGIGLGAFAAGTLLGAAGNPYYNPYYNTYYNPYYYPYGYYGYSYPATPGYAYYPPASGYAPRSCWDPYYGRYYAC